MEPKSHYVPQFIIFPFFLHLVFVFYEIHILYRIKPRSVNQQGSLHNSNVKGLHIFNEKIVYFSLYCLLFSINFSTSLCRPQ